MCAARNRGVFLDRSTSVVHTAVEIRVLWHMTGRQFPFALVWQAAGVHAVLVSQPCIVGFRVRGRHKIDRKIVLIGGMGAVFPVRRRGISACAFAGVYRAVRRHAGAKRETAAGVSPSAPIKVLTEVRAFLFLVANVNQK